MSVRARLGALVARWALFERHKPLEGVSRLPLRCWVTDIDLNLHMNNSRYLALMDLGRWHLTLTSGLAQELRRRRWMPVAVRIEIDFKRSIRPGEKFVLETFTSSVSTKSCVIAQRFWVGNELAADARAVVLFRGQGQTQLQAPLIEALPHLYAAVPPERPAATTEAEGSPQTSTETATR